MTLLWFTAFTVLTIILIYVVVRGVEQKKMAKMQLSAMAAVAKNENTTPMILAQKYVDSYVDTLSNPDLGHFMGLFCKQYGLKYRSDGDYVIAPEVRKELIERIAQKF